MNVRSIKEVGNELSPTSKQNFRNSFVKTSYPVVSKHNELKMVTGASEEEAENEDSVTTNELTLEQEMESAVETYPTDVSEDVCEIQGCAPIKEGIIVLPIETKIIKFLCQMFSNKRENNIV
ncbi:hypothetical protein Trydic_g22107 [Trypoxylus dichotomus]